MWTILEIVKSLPKNFMVAIYFQHGTKKKTKNKIKYPELETGDLKISEQCLPS